MFHSVPVKSVFMIQGGALRTSVITVNDSCFVCVRFFRALFSLTRRGRRRNASPHVADAESRGNDSALSMLRVLSRLDTSFPSHAAATLGALASVAAWATVATMI